MPAAGTEVLIIARPALLAQGVGNVDDAATAVLSYESHQDGLWRRARLRYGVRESEHVLDYAPLYGFVCMRRPRLIRRLHFHRGAGVDLQKPRFHLVVDEHVKCRELERVLVAAGYMMQPAYPGRELVFTRNGNIIECNGVFFRQKYMMTSLGGEGCRAYTENDEQTDMFRLKDGILLHSAIVKYGDEPSIQSQVFLRAATLGNHTR